MVVLRNSELFTHSHYYKLSWISMGSDSWRYTNKIPLVSTLTGCVTNWGDRQSTNFYVTSEQGNHTIWQRSAHLASIFITLSLSIGRYKFGFLLRISLFAFLVCFWKSPRHLISTSYELWVEFCWPHLRKCISMLLKTKQMIGEMIPLSFRKSYTGSMKVNDERFRRNKRKCYLK